MKKIISFIVVLAMMLSVSSVALAADTTITVSSADDLMNLQANFDSTINGQSYDKVTIELECDIDMSGRTWAPLHFNSYPAKNPNTVVFDGGENTISNLTDMLFSHTWTGKELTIKDLTLDKAAISEDVEDSNGNVGVGAFIGMVDSTETINLINCHLTNSKVVGGHWTGGLIGYATGYSKQDDGPVFTTVNIENCTVTNSTIEGKASIGGIVGHAAGSEWTLFKVSGGEVSGNTITSSGSSDIKAGDIIGTVGAAGKEAHGKTGGVEVNTTAKNNTVTSKGVAINRIYGRFGSSGSKLSITGGNYDTTREDNSFSDTNDSTLILASVGEALFAGEVDSNAPAPKPASTGSGISVKYNGGNSFSTSKSDVPTGVEIDGVPVTFNGNGSSFTVGCIDPNAKWVTVRWNSTSVTTNFTPDALVECSVSIPKTGDMPVWAAVLALFGF